MRLNWNQVVILAIMTVCIPVSAQDRGAEIYRANCVTCHGESGDADTPAGKALKAASFKSEEAMRRSDAELLATAKKGKGSMPSWMDSFSDQELRAVIAYIRTLQKKE